MQNFKKYGVAAAVAAVSVSSTAQTVSSRDNGDAAIVPYYTAQDGRITGVHIVNTTGYTQAVKFRMRRAADSADAMDFNIVMSPLDEWTGYIGKDDDGVFVGTSDNTCTVPKRLVDEGKAYIPNVYAEGAEEGYIEIIGMGQTWGTAVGTSGRSGVEGVVSALSTTTHVPEPVALASLHVKGTPLDCAKVERNFYRVSNDAYTAGHAASGANGIVAPGVHAYDLTSTGCTTAEKNAASAEDVAWLATTGTPAVASACSESALATHWSDTADNAFKVSYFIREGATEGNGGMEVGANAVHIEGFSDRYSDVDSSPGVDGDATMTNQVQLEFVEAQGGALKWDPLNFEFPNLGQALGNTGTTTDARVHATPTGHAAANYEHAQAIREALNSTYIYNEWADNANASADWVVTLPGQYAMRDGVCARYDAEAGTPCGAWTATTKIVLDDDQLPIYLNKNGSSKISIFDREEGVVVEVGVDIPAGIDFSPSSTAEEASDSDYLENEVNVLVFGSDDGGVLGSANAKTVSTLDTTEGWATMNIEPKNTSPTIMHIGGAIEAGEYLRRATVGVADSTVAAACVEAAGWAKCSQADYLTTYDAYEGSFKNVATAGLAVWKREFADNAAANYGRAIEHTMPYDGSDGYAGSEHAGR